jgi:Ran GTPase-activating protein (RanGAP) involved in mRNA processing and transport
MGALTSLHIGQNRIPAEEMRKIMTIAMRMDNMKILCEVPFKDKTLTELDVSGKNIGTEGALVVAGYLDGNGALTSLDISSNRIAPIEAVKKSEVPSWSIGDEVEHGGQKGEAVYWRGNPSDYIGFFDISGVAAITNAIRDMGAISTVNLLKNDIGIEQAKALAGILKEHPTLKSLCGNSGEETELDMSGKQIGADGAIMLAPEIAGNGALTKLDISANWLCGIDPRGYGWGQGPDSHSTSGLAALAKSITHIKELNISGNCLDVEGTTILTEAIKDNGALTVLSLQNNTLCAAGGKALAEGLKDNQVITQLNISSNRLGYKTSSNYDGTDMSGVIALADVIPDVGALTKLDISGNDIGAEQEEGLQRICATGGIELAK